MSHVYNVNTWWLQFAVTSAEFEYISPGLNFIVIPTDSERVINIIYLSLFGQYMDVRSSAEVYQIC